MIPDKVKSGAERALGIYFNNKVKSSGFSAIGGGCINAAGHLETSEGDLFVKWNDASAYPGMFEAEAKGLKILAEAGAIKVPEVILVDREDDQAFLITELIVPGKRQKDFWVHFGEAMAALHKNTDSHFGLEHDNYIGSLPQSNQQKESWIDFFIEERLEKQIAIARNAGSIGSSHIRKFEKIYPRLNEIFPEEQPALLHGDLWSGNFILGADGHACIIDPAVYYGHREMELAFTKLFGGFDASFYRAYNSAFLLEKGFDKRKDIYNLYPLLVHVNLFGGGYLAQVENILRQF